MKMKYTLDKFTPILYLDSDYNLRWKIDRRHCKKDSLAGSLNSDGYSQITVNGSNYYVHRIAYMMIHSLDSLDSNIILDHIDGNRSNNRPENLRIATKSTNGMNRGKQSNNTSGFKGVSFRKDVNKWLAKITKNGKAYHVGLFDTKEKAALAYCQAASEIHGEFSNTNQQSTQSTFLHEVP